MTKESGEVVRLTDLPNIGATAAAKLLEAGISTPEQLRKLGSVEAALRIKVESREDAPCRSMLSGLEGAIRGVRWHAIDKAERDQLWHRYQERLKEGAAGE